MKYHFDNNNNKKRKKNNIIVTETAVSLLTLTFFIVAGTITSTTTMIGVTTTTTTIIQSAEAYIDPVHNLKTEPKAPVVISGDNIYIAWWTDKGTPNTNGEVMFRASNDGGATFSDKMNLSNTPTADSVDAEIAAEGATVMVTWWERNQTSNTPVARISDDGGQTFGPMLRLGTNGTLTSTEGGGEEGETAEEEAVGGGAEAAE
jgi:hypothetical protein